LSKGSGDGDGFSKSSAAYHKHQELSQEILKLKTEKLQQEALLEAYQKENETLFSELRGIKVSYYFKILFNTIQILLFST